MSKLKYEYEILRRSYEELRANLNEAKFQRDEASGANYKLRAELDSQREQTRNEKYLADGYRDLSNKYKRRLNEAVELLDKIRSAPASGCVLVGNDRQPLEMYREIDAFLNKNKPSVPHDDRVDAYFATVRAALEDLEEEMKHDL